MSHDAELRRNVSLDISHRRTIEQTDAFTVFEFNETIFPESDMEGRLCRL